MRLIRRATTLLMASTSVQASTAPPAYDVGLRRVRFTGRLAVEYLTDRYATSGLKWAIAGRSRERLDAVLQETKAAVPIIVADATDAASSMPWSRRRRCSELRRQSVHHEGPTRRRSLRAPGRTMGRDGRSVYIERL